MVWALELLNEFKERVTFIESHGQNQKQIPLGSIELVENDLSLDWVTCIDRYRLYNYFLQKRKKEFYENLEENFGVQERPGNSRWYVVTIWKHSVLSSKFMSTLQFILKNGGSALRVFFN